MTGPFRVATTWNTLVIYDPHGHAARDTLAIPDGTVTGVLWATALQPMMAAEIVAALNTMNTRTAPETFPDGPFRHGRSWGLTVVYDPYYDPAGAIKTGTLWAIAQSREIAIRIVTALNQATTPHRSLEEEYAPARDLARALATAPQCGREIVPGWLCARLTIDGVCPDHGPVT